MELFERASQLQALNSVLNQVKMREGQGCVALVYGEAGIGKTSLVEHFVNENKKSWRILQGACDSLFTPRPLGPLHDIALQIASPMGTQGNLLALLNSESNREAIFSACLNELRSQSTIMIFEDIHWADEATLDLLKYLGRRIRQTSSLIILTYRDDELGVDHPLRLLLGDLGSSQVLHRIAVPSLSKDAVQSMAKGKHVDSVALHRLTNGNPFFVTEVLASEGGIPETVRDAVLARAARLSAPARSLLDAAAVIGSRLEPWLLSEMAGAESAKIEECISRGILQAQGDYYAFRHELTRQTILESISSQKKNALHRKTLNALKESPVTRENLARLAHHAEALNDPQAVLEFAPLAAWWAGELGAHREAAAHYKVALHHASMLSPQKHAELLDAYADECSLLDQRTEAKQAQGEALHIWHDLGQPEKEGRAFRRLAEIDHNFTLSPQREQNTRRAIEILETLPPSIELARAYSHMARLHLSLNVAIGRDPIYWGSRAIELAEKLGDVETLVHALSSIGAWQINTRHRAEGQTKLERSLQLSLEHDLQFHAARALVNLANELTIARDYAAGLTYVEKGIEYCIQHDLDFWLISFLTIRAQLRFEQGHWEEAEQDIQTVLKLRSNHETVEIMEPALLLLNLQERRGSPFSLEILNAVHEFLPEIDDLDNKCLFAALFAESAWLKGDLVQCRAEAEPTYQTASQYHEQFAHSNFFGFSELSYWMWRADAISEPPAGVMEPYASQIQGNWQEAALMWERFGCPYEQGMALMDGDEAAQLAALEIFQRLGARPIMEKLKQKMMADGIHIPRGPRPTTRENLFGLTTREMEVLECLAKGLSNDTIAKQLSLSVRTVEHHIATILRKMQVHSRKEAVALALEQHLLDPQ
jgi:DNA-binding CsgD family transcriptional regulator